MPRFGSLLAGYAGIVTGLYAYGWLRRTHVLPAVIELPGDSPPVGGFPHF